MDNFLQVIDQRVKKTIVESNVINTTPCIILDQVDSNNFSVRMLSNDCIYVLPNLSGSALENGDLCQVFYKGSFNQRNCFIGAALDRHKSENVVIPFDIVGTLPTIDFMSFAHCKILSTSNSSCLLNVNLNIQGLGQTELGLQIVVNGAIRKTLYKNVDNGKKEIISLSLPIFFEKNEKYKIQFKIKGNVNLLDFEGYIYGSNIEKTTIFDPTTDADYIYDTDNNAIIYYIGTSSNPQIPQVIQNTEVKKLYSTAFNYSNVDAVYIPEGIEEIE
jgi:hypothetical protein